FKNKKTSSYIWVAYAWRLTENEFFLKKSKITAPRRVVNVNCLNYQVLLKASLEDAKFPVHQLTTSHLYSIFNT
ncbi:MAG: hypothetical protein FWB86_12015, partial [Treponema sp.]|nr:hypothetical protein [Treponema sp.]